MQQLRGQGYPAIVVDGGDCFFATPGIKAPTSEEASRDMRKARILVHAYNLMGYQVMGVGPADLELGLEKLQEIEKEARFPFTSANLVDAQTKKPIFSPYVIITQGGIRFGFFSVMLERLNPSYAKRVIPNALVLDPASVAAKTAAELKTQCDVVVFLSQLNVDANESLLDTCADIDVVIDPLARNGVQAIWVSAGEYQLEHNKKPVLRIDGQGSRVGVFEMVFEKGAKKFSSYKSHDAPLEPHYMSHPEMVTLVAALERGSKQVPTIEYDPSKLRLSELFMGQEACGSCHDQQFKFWKATPHANTYANLEKTGDHLRPDCVGCHTLGYGVTFASTREIGGFKEVQCESCHALKAGHAENPKLVRFGPVVEDSCWGCHNPQITEKDFNYAAALKEASCPKIER